MASCPYPSHNWARANVANKTQQPATAAPSPTDIEHAMHTLSIDQPYSSWYMDKGETSHMTFTK
ncbi:hypothetical protein MTR_6g081380 [Medicago truncatula]|uniref:Uncharacterized protein n=1 Tax=Medicago truncatula TaxID=3880 RepID=A0A072UM97_MEDTR|nr:hypothetical protein MTR_6g081380 [Medicago truncatula]